LRSPKGTSALPLERDAWAFLDVAGITSSRQQEAVITLVRDLKQARLWTKMKAVYPFVGGTASSHKWNLKDPQDTNAAFRLTFFGGWTHSANGADPNGTSAYADTFMNASSVLTQWSACLTYYSRENSKRNDNIEMGSQGNGNELFCLIASRSNNFAAGVMYDQGSATYYASSSTANDGSGFWLTTRTSNAATALKLFRNNTNIGNSTALGPSAVPTQNIVIGALRASGNVITFYTDKQCAFATIGDGLTDSEATLLYNCVDRFQKFLGRAV